MESLNKNEKAIITAIMVRQLENAKNALIVHNKAFIKYKKESTKWWNNLSELTKKEVYSSLIEQYGTHENCILSENKIKVNALQATIDQLEPIVNKLTIQHQNEK